jgi:hypothetical protein
VSIGLSVATQTPQQIMMTFDTGKLQLNLSGEFNFDPSLCGMTSALS